MRGFGIPSYTELGEPWIKRWGEEMTGAEIVALTSTKPFDLGARLVFTMTDGKAAGFTLNQRGKDFAETRKS